MTLAGMKRLALALLLAMLALVALCVVLQPRYPWLAWVRAFAEAAAVGALADWFAVTALFRHPLGLPIPHTAIIPRNKDDIGAALGSFVEQNFLTPDHVVARLARERLALTVATWLHDPANRREVTRGAAAAAGWLVQRLDDADAQRFLGQLVASGVRRLDAARAAGVLLDTLVARASHQALLDPVLRTLDRWLQSNREVVRRQVRAGSRYMPGFVDNYIADRFVDGTIALLHAAAADPGHELRRQFDVAVRDAAHALQHSPRWQHRSRAMVRWLVGQARRERAAWVPLWEETRERLLADLADAGSVLREHGDAALAGVAEAIAADERMQAKLDAWVLQAIEAVLLRYRHHVGQLIAEVVKSWDAEEVSRKVEAEIGRDLQYIRINGTIVGGLAGLALHALVRVFS